MPCLNRLESKGNEPNLIKNMNCNGCHLRSDSQSVVHIISSRGQDWAEQHEVSVESSPTIIYRDVSTGDVSQSATSTIKALLELQQTTGD